MTAETQKVFIRVGENETELPVVSATDGANGIDIAGLMAKTGMSTFDQGFVNTSSTKSAITYIDGDQGILRYRGYPIEQLADQKSFLEVAYLLIYGELPSATELAEFDERIRKHTLLNEDMKDFFRAFPQSAHPMAVISAGVSALSTFYPDSLDPKDPEQVELSTIRLMAKLPVVAAHAHKTNLGQALMYPNNELSLVENFLHMTFGTQASEYAQNPVIT